MRTIVTGGPFLGEGDTPFTFSKQKAFKVQDPRIDIGIDCNHTHTHTHTHTLLVGKTTGRNNSACLKSRRMASGQLKYSVVWTSLKYSANVDPTRGNLTAQGRWEDVFTTDDCQPRIVKFFIKVLRRVASGSMEVMRIEGVRATKAEI